MEVEDQQAIIQIINLFVAGYPEGKFWTKEVVVKLANYCLLRDIPKLRIFHIVAQKDPGVIFGTWEIIAIDHDSDA